MTVGEQQRGALYGAPPEFPPGIDGRALLAPLFHSAWQHRGGAGRAYRVAVTEASPLLFAITYLGHHLRDQTTGLMSFAPHHLDMARRAKRLMGREPVMDAEVLPRGGAKSTWKFLIGPLWAMAHKHRQLALFVSYNGDQGEIQAGNVRAELAENELLLHDFPDLRPKRGSNTKRTVLTNGTGFASRGLFATSHGLKVSAARPDLIVGDDLQPGPENHSPEMKQKIEKALTSSIIPMGARHTAVQLAGTTMMTGCLMDDVGRAARGELVAPWIAAHGFRCHYYPAILDEGTPAERSLWPQRWSLEWLLAYRDAAPQDYALNYANRPELGGMRGYWHRGLIRYNGRRQIVRRVLYADVAITNKRTSDLSAVVMVGVTADGRTAVVEAARAGRWDGVELREVMWDLYGTAPKTCREWIIEVNQGGERWRELVSPIPEGVRLDLDYARGHKKDRLVVALGHYQRRAVEHAEPLEQLEQQMLAWTPAADRDDLLDALSGALRRIFPPSPLRSA